MRVSAALFAVAALGCWYAASIAFGQSAETAPECKRSQIPEKVTENGVVVLHCVRRPGTGTPAQQFGDFIHGNRFQHGARSYTFCASSHYQAKGSSGTYRVSKARRSKRKDGRVTITALIRLKSTSGKRADLKAVLTTKGLKINGRMFGFGGPAPPSAMCAPG
jgi:hypothetical protein